MVDMSESLIFSLQLAVDFGDVEVVFHFDENVDYL